MHPAPAVADPPDPTGPPKIPTKSEKSTLNRENLPGKVEPIKTDKGRTFPTQNGAKTKKSLPQNSPKRRNYPQNTPQKRPPTDPRPNEKRPLHPPGPLGRSDSLRKPSQAIKTPPTAGENFFKRPLTPQNDRDTAKTPISGTNAQNPVRTSGNFTHPTDPTPYAAPFPAPSHPPHPPSTTPDLKQSCSPPPKLRRGRILTSFRAIPTEFGRSYRDPRSNPNRSPRVLGGRSASENHPRRSKPPLKRPKIFLNGF